MTEFQRGKKKRLSMEETRQAVIDAGRRLLQERGLDAGLGLVTLNDAILESGVPRASAYRVYQSDETDPQDGFRAELLTSYLYDVALQRRSSQAEEVAAEVLATVDPSDPIALTAALREIIRRGLAANIQALIDDMDWRVIGPSMAVTSLTPAAPEGLSDAHRKLFAESRRHYRSIFQGIAAIFGMRLKNEMSWEDAGVLADFGPVISSFYWQHYPETRVIPRPTGPEGSMQDWTHGGILFEAFVLTAFESDPEAEVSADLSLWLG